MDFVPANEAGLTLFDGSCISWDTIQAGRYSLKEAANDRHHVAFARVSSEMQVKDGRSLHQQVDDACRKAKSDGQEITAVYLDPALSATKLAFRQRPGISKLLEDIKADRIHTVYVFKRDRISRQLHEWAPFLKTCILHEVRIVFTCTGEPPLGTGAYGEFQENIIMSMAAFEANLTRMRVRDSVLSRFREGRWIGGVAPYGLKKQDGRLVEDPVTGPIVKEIFELAHAQLWGTVRIADHLNRKFPGTRYGRMWTSHAVERVIKNKVYCGYLVMSFHEADGRPPSLMETPSAAIDPLVSEDRWNALATMRADRKRIYGSQPSRFLNSPSLLRGMLVCGVCGARMNSNCRVRTYCRKDGEVSRYRYRFYYCHRGARVHECCTYRGSVMQHNIDDVVIEACNSQVSLLNANEILERAKQYRAEQLADLRKLCETSRSALSRTESALERNQACLETCSPGEFDFYKTRIKQLLVQRQEHQAHLKRIDLAYERSMQAGISEDEVRTALQDWPARFMEASRSDQRAMLKDVIEKVVWHPIERSVDIVFKFDPNSESSFFGARDASDQVQGVAFCITKYVPIHKPRPEVA